MRQASGLSNSSELALRASVRACSVRGPGVSMGQQIGTSPKPHGSKPWRWEENGAERARYHIVTSLAAVRRTLWLLDADRSSPFKVRKFNCFGAIDVSR
ncbi:hypothetical protein CIB84_000062 [Bambusicola thoracicus]|uniref:Uncharacterized protein n=1 Tax=Bambusicola thoracicus TaxID=9083 RepID=A0A2P4TIK6_BAMTH|nr:hypothetical protein CIB84_000062 [Bambusicola thoracicus]